MAFGLFSEERDRRSFLVESFSWKPKKEHPVSRLFGPFSVMGKSSLKGIQKNTFDRSIFDASHCDISLGGLRGWPANWDALAFEDSIHYDLMAASNGKS